MSILLFTSGFINIGLLGENHHKINFIVVETLLLNEGRCSNIALTC
jgi:hypothetical protein